MYRSLSNIFVVVTTYTLNQRLQTFELFYYNVIKAKFCFSSDMIFNGSEAQVYIYSGKSCT